MKRLVQQLYLSIGFNENRLLSTTIEKSIKQNDFIINYFNFATIMKNVGYKIK